MLKTHLKWCLFVVLICSSQIRTSSSSCADNWLCKSIFDLTTFESSSALNEISNLIDNFSDELQYMKQNFGHRSDQQTNVEDKNEIRDVFDTVKYDQHKTNFKNVQYDPEKLNDLKTIDTNEYFINNEINNKKINNKEINNIYKSVDKIEQIIEQNDDLFTKSNDVLSYPDGEEQQALPSLPTTVHMKAHWDRKGQIMEGFGVFAGREEPFYDSKHRDKIMERLFSFDGLGLTIFRGQLYPNLDLLTNTFPPNETRAEAQIVLFKEAKKKYQIDKFILSSWSPPYKWKTMPGVPFGRVGSSINRLTHSKYGHFARYIVDYLAYCKKHGIDIYAISPQNEPEFPTTAWEGCVWWPAGLSHFLNQLKPVLAENGFDVKIMVGETGNWRAADLFLFLMRLFMKDASKQVDILASHGYSLPQISDLLVTYETSPRPWFLNSLSFFDKPRWITEASCTLSYDGSMTTAIKLAVSLHHFIANNHVSAYIYWLAMLDRYSNEALIFEDKDHDMLYYPKVYYIFGQFTKWIRPGFRRYDLSKKFFEYDSSGTLASMYLNEKTSDFVLVVINPHKSKKSTFKLDLNGAKIENEANLVGYKTTDELNWEPMDATEFILENNGTHLTTLNEHYSVKTISGKLIF